jgi:hypothetical protein
VGEERVVRFEGSVQLFISTMPESSFVDFSDAGTHPIFACCWIDGGRGETAHVTFSPGEPMGRFKIALKFRDNDFDKVKLQISMRMRDGETGNRRTVPLCSSCAFMQPMLRGEKDLFQMPDQFIDGSYARVSMSITNVGDFQAKPLRLRASNLDRLPEFNKHVAEVTAYMQGVMGKNNMSFPQGSQMKNGETRYPPLLVAFSLLLGTPAYVFLLPSPGQPRLRRARQPPDGGAGGPRRPLPLRDHERPAGVRAPPDPAPSSRVPHVPQGHPLGHDGPGGPRPPR